MITAPFSVASKPNQNDTPWDTLSDKEKLVLLAMLRAKNDKEAQQFSPVKKTQFFAYKKKLEPLKKQLAEQVLTKTIEILQGNSLRAAETLSELLDSSNPKTRQLAAEAVLDRTIGRPKIAIQQNTVNITPIQLIGVPQEKIDALFIPKQPATKHESPQNDAEIPLPVSD